MQASTREILACAALLLPALVAGCATPKKSGEPPAEKNMSRIVQLADGTTCVEPAGLAESRQKPGAVELRNLLGSDVKADEALAKAKTLKLNPDEAEAVYFDSCRAYANAEIPREAFENGRTVYQWLRQQFVAQSVKQWRDKKEGIADAGKLCLVSLPDTDPDYRSFTRVVPADSTVNDCAQMALASGSDQILLGCTRGHWENTWAKNPITVGPAGKKPKHLTAKGTVHAPDPDCGWN
jgi:hypothetical protein